MNKIIKSLSVIAFVGAIALTMTGAYFSDSRMSGTNTFTTGTINIDIEENTTWTNGFLMDDMKPSQTDYINFRVNNVGTNPVNIWKKITNINASDNNEPNEPECIAGDGTWIGPWDTGHCSGSYIAKYDLQYYINYDLAVEVYDDSGVLIWWQVIYRDVDNKTITVVYGSAGPKGILLGMIPAGGYMLVEQSYHLDKNVTNWAQNDSMTFDIEIMGEQLTNTVVLDNKIDADGNPGDVYLTQDDGTDATLTYKVKDYDFKYDFSAQGIANGNYVLVAGTNPWEAGRGGVNDTVEIDTFTVIANTINVTDQAVDLNQNLHNAKVWLILASDWNSGTKMMTGWHGSSYLFETALAEYWDTDL